LSLVAHGITAAAELVLVLTLYIEISGKKSWRTRIRNQTSRSNEYAVLRVDRLTAAHESVTQTA
jgi:hypothetical protein